MWLEKAHSFYIEDNKKLKLTTFVLMDVWKLVRHEAKWWIGYNKGLKQARKRKSSGNEDPEEDMDCNAYLEDVEEIPRPIEQKAAKKAAFEKKNLQMPTRRPLIR
jgi:hypothetical protein